jgi:hypothetical protein
MRFLVGLRLSPCLVISIFTVTVSGSSWAAPSGEHFLGLIHGQRAYARHIVKNDPSGDFETLYIEFWTTGRRHARSRYEVGSGLAPTVRVECIDFLHVGRKQVFASIKMNAPQPVVLDYDGRKVRKLYEPEGGRVYVSPVKSRGGRWKLREDWPLRQWEDHEDLGVGVLTNGNTVRRFLHWNGHRFVPDRPGRTRILRGGRAVGKGPDFSGRSGSRSK